MTIDLTPAVIGVLGLIAGASLQAAVQIWLARKEYIRKRKMEAYLTFFQGVAGSSFSLSKDQRDAANTLTATGRSLVALYGSEKVIHAMAQSFRLGGDLYGEHAWPVHATVIKEMREDASGQKFGIENRFIFELLYGNEGRIE